MDKKGQITYKIIEIAVAKGIRNIEENGNRGVRNIVDLGAHFAKGNFQKDFFRNAQQILNDENSMYYTLAKNLVKTVDHNIIKKFGINLGYNSLTYGVKKIRQNEIKYGYNIPWTIVFDYNLPAQSLSVKEVSDILYSGENLGIYCSMFFIGKNDTFLRELLTDLSSHKDSAYFIFAESEIITDEIIDTIVSAGNIVLVLLMHPTEDNDVSKQVYKKLLYKRCLYGTYSEYNDSNVNLTMSDAYINKIQKTYSSFVYLIKKQPLKFGNQERFSQFIIKAKNENPYPFYLVDFYEDLAYINRIISMEDCFIAINGNGDITVTQMNTLSNQNLNIKNLSLQDILKKTMPKNLYV